MDKGNPSPGLWWSKYHDSLQGEGKKGMWVRECTKNDGSLAKHFRAGCNLFTVPIIQIVHSEEYIQVCTKIYQSTKETTNRKIKMKTIFIQKIRVCLRYRCNTLADLVNKPLCVSLAYLFIGQTPPLLWHHSPTGKYSGMFTHFIFPTLQTFIKSSLYNNYLPVINPNIHIPHYWNT